MPPDDRLADAVREILRAEFPALTYGGLYEYACTGTLPGPGGVVLVDGRPTDSTIGLPPLSRVPCSGALHGASGTPGPGDLLAIEFVDGNPNAPECIGVLGTPDTVTMDATGTLSLGPSGDVALGLAQAVVARLYDSCAVYLNPTNAILTIGTVNGTHNVDAAILPISGGVATPCPGLITSGSSRVFA